MAQLAARRSHNPKVVSSILTRRICMNVLVSFVTYVWLSFLMPACALPSIRSTAKLLSV